MATIGAAKLTVSEVEARLAEQPEFVRARYTNPERKREFVDTLVNNELLSQEARRRNLDADAAVQAAVERALIQRLLQTELADAAVADAEVQAFYDANLEQFVRPERVRVSHLFIASPRSDDARTKAKADATRELAQVLAAKPEVRSLAFAAAVRRRSNDEPTKPQDGDLGLRTVEELRQAWGESFASAAFALAAPGDVGPVVETEKGFHLLRLTGRQGGTTETLAQAKGRIVARLQSESRGKRLDALVTKLKANTPVDIRPAALERVKVQVAPTLLDGNATPPAPGPP